MIRALWDVDAGGAARVRRPPLPAARRRARARAAAPVGDLGRRVQAADAAPDRPEGRRLAAEPAVPAADGDLAAGNAAIDARRAGGRPRPGRDPPAPERPGRADRRATLTPRFALEDGIGTFIVMADDAATIEAFAAEVAPAVRERARRARRGARRDRPPARTGGAAAPRGRRRVRAARRHADPGRRHAPERASRPGTSRRGRTGRRRAPRSTYTAPRPARRPAPVDVHDMLRTELAELRDLLGQVRDGALERRATRARR